MVGGGRTCLIQCGAALVYIFDSSVLSAFCVVGRFDLLRNRYSGRAVWTIEVQDEIIRGLAGTPSLSQVLAAAWLGEPVRSFKVDEIEQLRRRLGGGPRDRRHLGEAASIVVAREQGWTLVCDDRDAIAVARSESVCVITTVAILAACVSDSVLASDAAARLLSEMIDAHDRRLPRLGVDYFQSGTER